MKKLIVVILCIFCLVCQSGCLLGFAALVRWDQRRWEKMQAEKIEDQEDQEECSEIDKEP
jgi:hypothetical protein